MHRQPVLQMLERYRRRHPEEAPCIDRIEDLVTGHESCLMRSCQPGHITSSAWILSHDRQRFLLTHHRKLGRWLQLGGHVDGDPHPERSALREAREESGMHRFELLQPPDAGDGLVPLDVDVHPIPASDKEPAHFHHDLRFLLVAGPRQRLRVSSESLDLAWFPLAELAAVVTEESVLRMARKARAWLDPGNRLGPGGRAADNPEQFP